MVRAPPEAGSELSAGPSEERALSGGASPVHRAAVRGACADSRVGSRGGEGAGGGRGKEHKGSARKTEKALEVMAKGGLHCSLSGSTAHTIQTLLLKELPAAAGAWVRERQERKGNDGRAWESPRRRSLSKHLLGRRRG